MSREDQELLKEINELLRLYSALPAKLGEEELNCEVV